MDNEINDKLFTELRQYLLVKTGILYFGRIKTTPKNIMISCPFHKGGQERKPSCGVSRFSDERVVAGTVHCFTCGVTTNIDYMIQDILGELYNEDEVETNFNLKGLLGNELVKPKKEVLFDIPERKIVSNEILDSYRYYHPYLAERGITEETANKYDIGYDKYNDHITFPIRDINRFCLGIGRRSIKEKRYIYPEGFEKPLYGIYELPRFITSLWVTEGCFNVYSLSQYGKAGVGLLGTGTEKQYKDLLKVKCKNYVLALDGDNAGRHGIKKLGEFLTENHKMVYVALVLDNEDINSMTEEQFKDMNVLTFREWQRVYGGVT